MSEDKAVIGEAREGKFNGLRFRGWSSWRGSVNGFFDPGHRGVWS